VNSTVFRRSWISLAVAAAISVGFTQSLVAAPPAVEQEAPAAPEAKSPAGGLKTLAVISGARYEKLIADISFLGPYLGRPDAGQMADAMLGMFTGGKAATALDKTKPWGVIVQTDGSQFYYVAVIPIANVDDLLEIAKMHQAEIKDAENGTKELSIPGKPPAFLKTENGVAFLSLAPTSLAKLPANPLEILGKMVGEYDLAVALRVRNIPEMYRQFAIGAMQAGMQQNMKRGENETDEEFAAKQKLAEAQLSQITQMINEVDTVKLGWAIDPKEKRTFLDFDYKFIPGSKLAGQLAAYKEQTTDFGGFYQPSAAATAAFASKADPKAVAENAAQVDAMLQNFRQQVEREIDKKHSDAKEREELKAAAGDIFGAIEATLKEGHMDGAVAISLSPGATTVVGGIHVKEPAKIEDALKKLEAVAKDKPGFPGVKWNAAKHGEVSFHTLNAPVPEDKDELQKMFGDSLELAVGIGGDAVYLGVGKDNVAAVGKAIDASAAGKDKKVPPFSASLALGPIMDFAAEVSDKDREKQIFTAIAAKLKGNTKDRDHIRMYGQLIDSGLRYHFEAEEGVLEAIGTAAQMKQKAAAGN
jgi:hypothetical protein